MELGRPLVIQTSASIHVDLSTMTDRACLVPHGLLSDCHMGIINDVARFVTGLYISRSRSRIEAKFISLERYRRDEHNDVIRFRF